MTLWSETRGQTLYDFVIGMAVFLLVMGYVFAFLPGLFSPFSPDTDSIPVRADRTVDFLTEDLLVEANQSGVFNRTCTKYFFNGTSPDNCDRFSSEVNASTVRNRTGLSDRTNLNVTMVRNGSIANVDGDKLALGSDPTGVSDRITRVERIVSFDGRDYRFVVKIW